MRRRVPAWHDLDEPVLTGALFEKESFALGALARGPFFDAFVDESLTASFEQFARKTGRQYEAISRYRLDDAKTVLLAQGAAVETARVAADCLRKQHKIKVGVLGIHALRPFPGAAIANALEGRDSVFVLERTAAPMSGEPPLTREIRASMDRLDGKRRPRCSPVSTASADCRYALPTSSSSALALTGTRPEPLFLGLAFDDTSGEQPKREVLLDALRRAYPNAAEARHPGSTQCARSETERLAHDRNTPRRRRQGNPRRSRRPAPRTRRRPGTHPPAVAWERWSDTSVDWLTHGDESLHDPGDDLVADVTLNLPQR